LNLLPSISKLIVDTYFAKVMYMCTQKNTFYNFQIFHF